VAIFDVDVLGVFSFFDRRPQGCTGRSAMAVDLVKCVIAARFRGGEESVDALDFVKVQNERLARNGIDGQTRLC
jgi:hypothetical protein